MTATPVLPSFYAFSGAAAAPDGGPARTAMLLHGILGSGANWRSFVRRLAASPEAAGWRFVVPDLRGHGDSPGSGGGAAVSGPHTVAACAADLLDLQRHLGVPFTWVIGHSFGGKVACVFAREAVATLRSLWLLDTPPGRVALVDRATGDDSVTRVLAAIRAIGEPLAGRDETIAALVDRGIPRPIAIWLGTSVRRSPDDTWGWRFASSVIDDLISDYAELDCLPWLGGPEAPTLRRVLVRGGLSDRFDANELAGLAAMPRIEQHVLPSAGHWLHVDDPDGLLGLMLAELKRFSADC